jgi:hypothetical protein
VQRAGSVTYQSVQTVLNGKSLRLFLIGYQLGRPGGPRKLLAGRDIIRRHYEMVVDRSAGLALGQEVPLGDIGAERPLTFYNSERQKCPQQNPFAGLPSHES